MNDSEIRAFAERYRAGQAGFDRVYWAAEYRRSGFIAAQKASLALQRHMKSIRPGWPDNRDRKQDLDHHIVMKKLLERNADALAAGSPIQRP
jgi:hypothetical protein